MVKVMVRAAHEYSAQCGKMQEDKDRLLRYDQGEIERRSIAAGIRWLEYADSQVVIVVNASKYGGDFSRAFQ